MAHNHSLAQAAQQADKLGVLLMLLEIAHRELDDGDLSTALSLASDLSGTASTWLLEEQKQRGQSHE
ncbi:MULTISPECIES: hypothetical protein [Pectobacterium]|uniref:hypothetical protein n=1 Tax=Pectobacterium TaxID=122277 RepID=UPI00102E43BE|nr:MULTISPECIES: hypothetical protein [Pectobacterium]TAI99389.1 hypothetical protein EG332_04760 [Pectobacterium versatile]UEQ07822.1 hypothetical protein LLE50_13175 [Pectobacterium versatile]WJM82899.1 hypothetical protein QTI90_09195 [Pectobacterium brasiliense]